MRKMYAFVENYGGAFVVSSLLTKKVIYTNRKFKSLFGDIGLNCDFDVIFKSDKSYFDDVVESLATTGENTTIYDYKALTHTGEEIVVDLQVGYFDEDKTEIFLDLMPKNDNRMEMALYHLNHSSKPEAIMNYDEEFSIVECNEQFRGLFGDDGVLHDFLPQVEEELSSKITENLKSTKRYSTKFRVSTSVDEEQWYLLELERRTLDNSGEDKIVVTMTNIEKQVEIEEEHSVMQKCLNSVQELANDIIYHIDVKTRTLYHNIQTPVGEKIGTSIENYIEVLEKEKIIHPDDIEGYIKYLKEWYYNDAHDNTEFKVRVALIEGEYKSYVVRGKKIYDINGELTNAIGVMVNVENEIKLQREFAKTQQFFTAMQELTEDILFHIDIKTKTFTHKHRNTIDVPLVIPNYVDVFVESGYIYADDVESYRDYTDNIFAGKNNDYEVRALVSENTFEWFKIKCKYLYDESDKPVEIFGKMENIQNQKNLELKSSQCLMTKVFNKVSFEEKVSSIIEDSDDGCKHALIFIDLDDFKGINDNLGHAYGDELLITVANRLKAVVRNYDLVGRLGGDEFAVFLNGIADEDITLLRSNLILEELQKHFEYQNVQNDIKASLGVAMFPNHGKTCKELLEKSDLALYKSKGKGKNVVSFYNEELA